MILWPFLLDMNIPALSLIMVMSDVGDAEIEDNWVTVELLV
jgi:hypothetical protein